MIDFAVPDLGEGLEDATVSQWQVAVGDQVELNQVLCTVETAKAAVEMMAAAYDAIAAGTAPGLGAIEGERAGGVAGSSVDAGASWPSSGATTRTPARSASTSRSCSSVCRSSRCLRRFSASFFASIASAPNRARSHTGSRSLHSDGQRGANTSAMES